MRAHSRVDADRVALWLFSGAGPLAAEYLRRPPKWLRCLALTYPLLEGLDGDLPAPYRPLDSAARSP